LWHDDWKPKYFIAKQWLGKHNFAEANERDNRTALFFVVRAVSTLYNRGSGVLCGAAPRLYNEHLKQLELELSRVPELEIDRIVKKKWQERK
jgi:phenylalanine-4-hydroxylase